MLRSVKKPGVVAVALAAVSAATAAAGGLGPLRLESHQVVALAGNGFEVLEEQWDGPSDYWCIAALHARHRLGGSNATRIYLIRPYGPSQSNPQRRSVGFTISPDADVQSKGETISSFSVSIKKVASNYSIGHAQQFCNREEIG